MSASYILEPPTNGKVLLHTSCGDIDVELWSKETPRACRNFIQLCLEGYYNGTIFHRVIPGFMVQGGDPTGTGDGGESSYGETFKDEFHSRLKFVRRGLVAMANAGPNDNGSQFFFTFDRCDHLNNKHTIFGKVVGNTIYNMIKLSECEIGQDDRPIYPPVIRTTEVLANPFDDIIPRQLKKAKEKDVAKKNKSKATKNFSLLSFGEEAEEDEEEVNEASIEMKRKHKSKSAHDLGNDPNLSSKAAVNVSKPKPLPDDVIIDEDGDLDRSCHDDTMNAIRNKLHRSSDKPKGVQGVGNADRLKREAPSRESDALRRDVKDMRRRSEGDDVKRKEDGEKADMDEEDQEQTEPTGDMISDFRIQKKKFRQMKKSQAKGANREEQTLAILAKFQNHLHQAIEADDGSTKDKAPPENEDGEMDEYEDDVEVTGFTWMAHTLHFDAHSAKVKDANMKDADTFSIFDPRNPMNERRREEHPKSKGRKSK